MEAFNAGLSERLQTALGEQYVLERQIGHGGMGVVFVARDKTLDRQVAIKVVQPDLASHASIAGRFLTEARTVARLRHPNIVAIHAAGEVDGLLYYVMDYVEGESLRQRLTREERLPVEEARSILKDVASALHAAAGAGVVHRDVKPANVLLEAESGRAMLVDFGIARMAGGDGSKVITGDGLVLGTPTYMSPEQASGEEIDARSDLYALGVMGYEMLAGRPPFEGSYRVVVSQHLSANPKPIRRVRPDCPPNLAYAVMRAIAKPLTERWQTGADFVAAADAPAPPVRTRRRAGLLGVAAALATLLVGAMVLRGNGAGPPEGINPRHSLLVLPFHNLRADPAVEWLRDGGLSMLVLNLSQWDDLTVVDHGRVPTLLAQHKIGPGDVITVDQARQIARDAGVWTVVMGEFDRAGDSLRVTALVYDVASGDRVDLASVSDAPGEDVRPLFDQLAASLLDVSGAPDEVTADLARATTRSLEAYRAYLSGVTHLNNWELGEAVLDLERATAIDSTFGLAYYSLALARGWIIGPDDEESTRAIALAGRYSAHLPLAQRTLIRAYRAFLDREYATARRYYQELVTRGLHTTEAWYGLGDAWFHDDKAPSAERWTNALRAFTRTVELDPGFTLAFEHVDFMLHTAGRAYPPIALVTADSFAMARTPEGELLMDSVALAEAVERARDQSLQLAQNWVAYQPNGLRAQHALVDAYANSGEFRSALAETDQMEADGTPHPELPFVRARIFFASGDADRAGEVLREAMDSVTPQDFGQLDRDINLVQSVEASANVFAYTGHLTEAAQTIRFADQVRTVLAIRPATHNVDLDPLQNQRRLLSYLYSSAGAPVAMQRRVWESAAEAARRAPAEDRAKVASSGAAAALGIFLQTNDTTALTELRALTGQEFSREVRAWLAINEDDLDGARAILEASDSTATFRSDFRRPMQAEVYFALGDYWKTVSLLEEFQPNHFPTDYFDARWGMLGRVRLLRAMAYEEMGRLDEAQREYREVVAQWQTADQPFEDLRTRAEERLASLAGRAG